ncbi:hypothetical protein AO364_0664 [Moraxella catarrhalis]|nr:hypothetical protein AO376_1683 [Moraxella catarrhalis]OAV19040.1 hypothetical protein AO374_0859 [Moraxella catarrhalis]OAV30193.1 hypothetical protein AO367_1425 [Moraxella catarrhalis]OAV37411.1 hypothetical protein AO364_0664 [Moraxella catarrhalis]
MMIKSNLASSLKISGQRTDGVLILVLFLLLFPKISFIIS